MNDNPLVNPLLIEDFANPLTAETSAYFNFDPTNIPTYDPRASQKHSWSCRSTLRAELETHLLRDMATSRRPKK